jgi:hypothetical protein
MYARRVFQSAQASKEDRMRRQWTRHLVALGLVLTAAVFVPATGGAQTPPWTTVTSDFESPLFGLTKGPGHRLLVADAGAGPTVVRRGSTRLLAAVPGVTDVAPLGRRGVLALTGGGTAALYRVSRDGTVTQIADLGAFEAAVDPANDGVESNPFDLAKLHGRKTLVADAAGNSILIVDRRGRIDWVASLPRHPDNADSVPTTVAIGPGGDIYVGELTGVPATPGTSRIWRIKRGARHAVCGVSPKCSIVDTGPFTSIIDIQFGPGRGDDDDDDDEDRRTAYVVELDEASWLALEQGQGVGGTVNTCEVRRQSWSCEVLATELPMPTAVALDGRKVYSTLFSLVPGQAQVARLR